MKTCACCFTSTSDATCPSCGESSWTDAAATSEQPKPRASRRGRAAATTDSSDISDAEKDDK